MPIGDAKEPDSFGEKVCLPFLLSSQNKDGGWGYRLRSRSRVESTSWALIALQNLPQVDPWKEVIDRGVKWLLSSQLADGSWPSHPEEKQGSWCTSLSLLALHAHGLDSPVVAKGLAWLLRTWPAEGGVWWRCRYWLQRSPRVVHQNFALRGWNWTPGTSSWVEPTSYALLVLQSHQEISSDRRLLRRRRLGEAMLLDRMCPGGGWNAGNPLVYGVAGRPAIGPTVWALLALRSKPTRPEVIQSLDWLELACGGILGPGSISLAQICLETFGRRPEPLEPRLRSCYETNQFLDDLLTFAWAILALNSNRRLLSAG